MYKILKREEYSPTTYMWEVEAPDVAKAAQPGHFVMVKHSEQGERIPLTVADFDREKGTVTLVIQAIGKSTQMYQKLKEDLQIIKNLGVNSVRFAKSTPHPFALNICQELGLFAFVLGFGSG